MADNENQAPVQVPVENPMDHMGWAEQFNTLRDPNSWVFRLLHPVSVISETETQSIVDPAQIPANQDTPILRWHPENVTLVPEDLYGNQHARRLQLLQAGHLLYSLLTFYGCFDDFGTIGEVRVV